MSKNKKWKFFDYQLSISLLFLLPLTGCLSLFETKPATEDVPLVNNSSRLPAVDIVTVSRQRLTQPRTYIGTTEPIKEVIIRSQTQGQLLGLTVDVGDMVRQGQVIAKLDDSLAQVALTQAQARLSELQSLLVEAKAEVNSAIANIKSAQIELEQSQIDYERLKELNREGAIALRDVELARTQAQTNQQLVISAQAQVKVRQARITTIANQIKSQQALIQAEQKRLTFNTIIAPSDGYVLEKLTEVGSLLRVGEEVIKIGDLSQIKVKLTISELDLNQVSLNKQVTVTLDAFEDKKLIGIVQKISPVAEVQARQIPIEILVSNANAEIKSGLLARVTFIDETKAPIVIPQSALDIEENKQNNIVFVLTNQNQDNTVEARLVNLGKKNNSQVEILSGVAPEEQIVVRSTSKLKDGQKVRLSAISTPSQ